MVVYNSERSGSVECPYCGHQVAKNVIYNGQQMRCRNCTSPLVAPTYSPPPFGWLDPKRMRRWLPSFSNSIYSGIRGFEQHVTAAP